MPKPLSVLNKLAELSVTASFWEAVLGSIWRIFAGYCAGILLGTLLGMMTSWSKSLDVLMTPVLQVVKATPVASFIILTLVWLKSTTIPAFIAMLIVIPVVWGNVSEGIRMTDKELLEVAQVFQFNRRKKLKTVYAPSVKPYFSSACTTALGMAWKSGVAAEVLCQPKAAIGSNLYYSKIYLETPSLFAWTLVIIILSMLLEKVLAKLIGRI